MFPIKKNRVGHFGAYKSLSERKRILVTLTGVVPRGESHPEEEGGDEEKSERRENRRLLQRINLKKMSSTECFVTLPPHFQYPNKTSQELRMLSRSLSVY